MTPTKKEIIEYMELHNDDEVGIDNQWTFEEAEYFLLLDEEEIDNLGYMRKYKVNN